MSQYPDFVRAPNIAGNPDTYEKENRAIDPSGALWRALRDAADWSGRALVPPHCEPGVREALRVLRPGGTLVVIDNDLRHGEFAGLLRESVWAEPQGTADVTDEWWRHHGARRREVMSAWACADPAELEEVLRIEFPGRSTDPWRRETHQPADPSSRHAHTFHSGRLIQSGDTER